APARTGRSDIPVSTLRSGPSPAIFPRREGFSLFEAVPLLSRPLLCPCRIGPARARSIPLAPSPPPSRPVFLFHSKALRTDEAHLPCGRENWRYGRPFRARLRDRDSGPSRRQPAGKYRQLRPYDRAPRDSELRNNAPTTRPRVPLISRPTDETA